MVNVKPVTLYDVAEYAGVSLSDRFPRGEPGLPRFCENAGKVEAAMAELNYIPNRVAQQLAGKQSLLIGVATSSLACTRRRKLSRRLNLAPINWVPAWWCRWLNEAASKPVKRRCTIFAQRVSGLIINYPLDDQDAIAVEAACANVPALFLDVSDQTPINSIIFSP